MVDGKVINVNKSPAVPAERQLATHPNVPKYSVQPKLLPSAFAFDSFSLS